MEGEGVAQLSAISAVVAPPRSQMGTEVDPTQHGPSGIAQDCREELYPQVDGVLRDGAPDPCCTYAILAGSDLVIARSRPADAVGTKRS